MDNKKLLGKRIKELRKLRGYTQEKLAEMIGIETTSLSGIESGRHYPSMLTIEKLSENLKVEINAFFEFNHLKDIPELKKYIRNNFENFNNDEIKLLYYILKIK